MSVSLSSHFRSRSRQNLQEASPNLDSSDKFSPNFMASTSRLSLSRRRKINRFLFVFSVLFLALFVFYAYILVYDPVRLNQTSPPTMTISIGSPSQPQSREDGTLNVNFGQGHNSTSRSSPASPYLQVKKSVTKASRTGAVPVVYRTVLERLDQLWNIQEALSNPAAPYLSSSIPYFNVNVETESFYSTKQPIADVCGNPPCQFLLPLRIAEQESKARIHLFEIIQTAKLLDRVLVLPHVGKSRLGLCFRWGFEAYYNEESLLQTLHEESVRVVTLEAFKLWLESNPSPAPRAQLLSLESKPASNRPNTLAFTDGHLNGLVTTVDVDPILAQDPRFPGCFGDSFGSLLNLSDFAPISIYPSAALSKTLRKQSIGDEIITALGRGDIKSAASINPNNHNHNPNPVGEEPEVLMLDWGLRYPIYRQPFKGSIAYSPLLERLTKEVSPSVPYLMIHWRMESVTPDVLPECAHDLVDTISRLLHDHDLADGIEKVWFAGDYPFPIAHHLYPRASDRTRTTTLKSGTFRSFGEKHTEAVDILVDAFREGGELSRWGITDLAAELVRVQEKDALRDVHPEFLSDSGALGIVDKMVGIHAALFVGGSKRCGRTSSFTKQVIDSRRNGVAGQLRNIIDYFG